MANKKVKEYVEPEIMPNDDLSNLVQGEFRDDTGLTIGIQTITDIKESSPDSQNTDIELKTIITEEEKVVHTIVEFISKVMTMSNEDMETQPVIAGLTEKLERKSLSLQGLARKQVVEMVKGSEVQDQTQQKGWKRMFQPQRQF